MDSKNTLTREERKAERQKKKLAQLEINSNSGEKVDLKTYLQKAEEFNQNKQWNKALICYEKALKLKPNNPVIYLQLAKVYKQRGQLSELIAACQKAIQLQPQQQILVYKELGDSLLIKNKTEEAINILQQALTLENDAPASICASLGRAYHQQKEWQKACEYFELALEKQTNFGSEVYLQYQDALIKQGEIEKADAVFKQALEFHYLMDKNHKIIYCPIAKNATSLLRGLMVNINQQTGLLQQQKKLKNKKQTQDRNYSKEFVIAKNEGLQLQSLMDNPEYLKLLILRNPFNRLVSGYLNKIAGCRYYPQFTLKVIEDVYYFLGKETNVKKSITFEQFIHYLVRTENCDLNHHWRPQYTFLGFDINQFDLVGRVEEIGYVIESLEQKFGIKLNNEPTRNSTLYGKYKPEEKFHKKYPEQLRALSGFPKAPNLYTPELEALVRVRYAEDIKLYESQFNLILPSFN